MWTCTRRCGITQTQLWVEMVVYYRLKPDKDESPSRTETCHKRSIQQTHCGANIHAWNIQKVKDCVQTVKSIRAAGQSLMQKMPQFVGKPQNVATTFISLFLELPPRWNRHILQPKQLRCQKHWFKWKQHKDNRSNVETGNFNCVFRNDILV